MTVVKAAAECDTVMSAYPNEGTTAGGTWVDVYGAAGAFASSVETAAKSVGVAGNNNCATPNTIWLPVGDVDWLDGHHIKIRMLSAVSEAKAALLIDNDPGTPAVTYCRADSYFYKTLAFTANQDSRDISIVDTVDNEVFALSSDIAMPGLFSMINMAYDRGAHPGRTLFLPDELTGDLAFVDAANFELDGILNAQEPNIYARVLQPDIAVAPDGDYAFVSYLTKGYPIGVPTPDNPESGGVEVIGLTAAACEDPTFPCVYDIDHNAGTTSPGAPSGITRLSADSPYFYPLDIEIVDLRRPDLANYAEGEKYPGVYAFISAVGELVTDCLNPPDCTEYDIRPRPAVIGIIDLNPGICTLDAGKPCGQQTVNADYWKQSHKILAPIVIGQDGEGLGNISQGMDFTANFAASPVPNATVYAVNPTENAVYRIKYMYNSETHSVSWERVDPAIGGFSTPTDVKVQKVGTATYAYITNAGNDRVTVVNTTTDTVTGEPFKQDECSDKDHYPTSMDTRSRPTQGGAHHGYSADYHTGAVSVYDLQAQTMNASVCSIPVGQAPIRIVVQPVPGPDTFFDTVRSALAFAPPTAFETPSKQHILIADWERVKELEDTNADPQAVLANIDNFQHNVDNWVTDETVKNNVNEGVDLYRAAYLQEHP
jgi:hypothetical protein